MTLTTDPSRAAGETDQVVQRLARRVAKLRKLRGMPRRVLSERSGVSPRYLAQLEAAEGNISLRLLHRVAQALDVPVVALLADAPPMERDARQIATLFQNATPKVQDQVRALLAPQDPGFLRAGRICLIGLRGAGKSTLGKLAGKALNLPFVELNAEIETAAQMPLSDVMAFYGEAGYRRLEAEALAQVTATHDRVVLAVAGGLVAEPDTFAHLLERFHTVWITTSPAEHMQRVRAQGDHRPMQGNPAAMAQLKDLLQARTPLYARADAQVDTANRVVGSSLNDLLAVIAKHRFLASTE